MPNINEDADTAEFIVQYTYKDKEHWITLTEPFTRFADAHAFIQRQAYWPEAEEIDFRIRFVQSRNFVLWNSRDLEK